MKYIAKKLISVENNSMIHNYKFIIAFLVFTFISVLGLQAQSKSVLEIDSLKVESKSISINDISVETEKIGKRIADLRDILKPSSEIKEVDSLLNMIKQEIHLKKDSLLLKLGKMNKRALKVSLIEWNNYRSNLKEYQDILKARTEDLSDINNEILRENLRWEKTKEELVKRSESKDIYSSLDRVLETLQEMIKMAHDRLDKIFIIQKNITQLILMVDDTTTEIKLAEQQIQRNYFTFDSQPLWKTSAIGLSSSDSLKTEMAYPIEPVKSIAKENGAEIKSFLSSNVKTVFFQITFILLLFVLLIIVNKKWNKNINELTNPIEIQTKKVLTHPVSSALVSGLLISAFFYKAFIPVVAEFHIILILFTTVYLLPKLTNKRFRLFLLLIFMVYLIHTFEAYLGVKSTKIRWLLVIDAIVLIVALILGRKTMRRFPESFKTIYHLFMVISPLFISILFVSFIVNIIGMVGLSRFLIKGVLLSVALGMVVYLAVKVITSLFILLFKLRKSSSIQTFANIINVAHKRIQPILNLAGFMVWIYFTLKAFEIYDFLSAWVNQLMLVHWEIGEMTISLGGILSFFGIFIIALFLAKQAAAIFQEEWMVNILPRGVAPAISLILRILLVGIGLYMALSAAGLDLSKLGFMLGALGVGIGFGLQNVVLNFVAGLILAFERPINLGDTIEIDQEFGVVTSIGVRSSNIKSYSGYEAIIPNGDLISKKVINYTLTNRDRRSKILMKTSPTADPEMIIDLFNKIANENPMTKKDPAPKTYFYGYDPEGNLSFALLYWTTFSDTLKTDSAIALKIFSKLKEEGIEPPAPLRRIVGNK